MGEEVLRARVKVSGVPPLPQSRSPCEMLHSRLMYFFITSRHRLFKFLGSFSGTIHNFFVPRKLSSSECRSVRKAVDRSPLSYLLFNSIVAVIFCWHTVTNSPSLYLHGFACCCWNPQPLGASAVLPENKLATEHRQSLEKFFRNLGNLPVVKFSITHHRCSSLSRTALLQCLAICALSTCLGGEQISTFFF